MAKDSLASGSKSANFGSMCHISDEKWESIFGDGTVIEEKPKHTKLTFHHDGGNEHYHDENGTIISKEVGDAIVHRQNSIQKSDNRQGRD